MSIDAALITEIARRFLTAEERRSPLAPISSMYPNLTEDDAYRIQRTLVRTKAQRGDKVIGRKVGATSEAIQQMLGIREPVYGHLLESHRVGDGEKLALSELIHPRIECEIAFLLNQGIAGPGITPSDVLAVTKVVMASLEINDPRTKDWKVGRWEVIADNALAARFVLGHQQVSPEGLDLRNVGVVLRKNGGQIAKSTGAAVLGDPANAVAWLANKVAEHDQALEAGDLVLPGSLTPIYEVDIGDNIEAIFEGIGTVSVEFV